MATNNTEALNFKVTATGNSDADERKPCNLHRLTLEKVHKWLDARELDDATKKRLKKMCSMYPEEALENWLNNFTIHLSRAREYLAKNTKPKTVEETFEDVFPEVVVQDKDITPGAAPHVQEFE